MSSAISQAAPELAGGLGALTGIAALNSGKATSDADQYKAQLAQQSAAQATAAAQNQATEVDINSFKKIGAATAGYAAGGVTTTSGSPLAVIQSSANSAKFDEQNALYGGAVKSTAFTNQANIDLQNSSSALAAGRIGMFTNFITGGLNAGNLLGGGSSAGQSQSAYESSAGGMALADSATDVAGAGTSLGATGGLADLSELALA